jgi:hypothetical protein
MFCRQNYKRSIQNHLVDLLEHQELLIGSSISAKARVLCVFCSQNYAFLIFSLHGNIVLSARIKKKINKK